MEYKLAPNRTSNLIPYHSGSLRYLHSYALTSSIIDCTGIRGFLKRWRHDIPGYTRLHYIRYMGTNWHSELLCFSLPIPRDGGSVRYTDSDSAPALIRGRICCRIGEGLGFGAGSDMMPPRIPCRLSSNEGPRLKLRYKLLLVLLNSPFNCVICL